MGSLSLAYTFNGLNEITMGACVEAPPCRPLSGPVSLIKAVGVIYVLSWGLSLLNRSGQLAVILGSGSP